MKIAKTLTADQLLRTALLGVTALVIVLALGWQYAQAQDPMAVPSAPAPAAINDPMMNAPVDAPTAPMDTTVTSAPMDPSMAQANPAVPQAPTTATNSAAASVVPATPASAVPGAPEAAAYPTPTTASAIPTAPSMPMDLPNAAPSNLAGVVRDLQDAQKNVSVDDMARAEDALARLDLLLAIQKKVNELKEAQNQENDSSGSVNFAGMPAGASAVPASAIPASALSLPSATPVAVPTSTPVRSHSSSESGSGKYKVEQISGANGNFNAVVTDDEGDRRIVRIGDKMGSRTITNISADGIELRGAKGSTKTLSVENGGFALTPFAR